MDPSQNCKSAGIPTHRRISYMIHQYAEKCGASTVPVLVLLHATGGTGLVLY
jgi:hypothetical protein